MSQRKKTILLIIVIIVIGILIVLWFSYEPSVQPITETNQAAEQNQNQNQAPAGVTLPPAPVPNTLTGAEQKFYGVARNFAERFGSFSTDSNYANLEEVKLFATEKMIAELDRIIADSQRAGSFYGVTSKVLKVDIKEMDESQGLAVVSLQRQETKAGRPDLVYYQDLNLDLVKQGDDWKVDAAIWQ